MRGFTLVEILIVTAITIILIAASFPIYENFQRDGKLDVARIELQENLKNVQAQAQAGVNDSSHGVYFNSNSYIAYQGNSYAARDTDYDITYDVINNVIIVNAPVEILFTKKTGLPASAVTVTLQNQIDTEQKTVEVNEIGLIE
ncbi:hypothetical protein HN958_01305 [Candidatus Falkowbacteria bacterium]|jgi:type II secretory pathway pseudopilin PulG|nr:hypothetical protein [Candidatus Falkowbacteria bacterium]MBT7007122.1 hypothetical protein [Candidatus Falkowbacteria bacterium]